jgi:hypothetical protein
MDLSRANTITILAGVFFVLLDVYWAAVYFWSRLKHRNTTLYHRCDFSVLGFCWWILSVYFIVVLAFFLDELHKNYRIIFGSGTPSTSDKAYTDSTDVLMIKTAFVCMVAYLYFCTAVFAVMKLERIISKRWS